MAKICRKKGNRGDLERKRQNLPLNQPTNKGGVSKTHGAFAALRKTTESFVHNINSILSYIFQRPHFF